MNEHEEITKMGVHVNTGTRYGYGEVAQAGPAAVVSFEAGAFDELPEETIKIWRTQSVANHTDAPGDIDHLTVERAYAAAFYWGEKLWALFEPVHRRYKNVFLAPVNETGAAGNPGDSAQSMRNMAAYMRGWVDFANEKGFKIALWACAGGSPNWTWWEQYVVPTLAYAAPHGHIYKRHAYGGVPAGFPGSLTDHAGIPQTTNTLRPFREAVYLDLHNIEIPIVIGEAGQNGGFGFVGVDEFLRDHAAYDAFACRPDHRLIVGICAWSYGEWNSPSSNIQDVSERLAEYLRGRVIYQLEPKPVTSEETIYIDTSDGILLHLPQQHHLSQRDPRWANIDLDGKVGGRTIGEWFCLGVAYNMLARVWGFTEMLPGQFHQAMRQAGAMSGEAIVAGALKRMYPDVIYDGYIFRQSPHMRKRLRDFLEAGIPVIGRVDFNPATSQIDQHWVLITGENSRNELICIDPWTGKEENINHKYGIAGSDVVEILMYRPLGVTFPKGEGNKDENGGSMPMQPQLRDFPLIVDVSEFRPNVPMIGLNKQGIYGVRIRVSTGKRFDRAFHANMQLVIDALRAGEELSVGGYHDLDERYDLAEQADIFQIGLANYDCWSAGWGFSVEPIPGKRKTPTNEQVTQFVQMMDTRIGRRAIEMYSTRKLITENGIRHHNALLWIAAHYNGDIDPALPDEFERWHLHQFTDNFKIEGYPLGVDCSYFNGTLDELRHYSRAGWLVIDPVTAPPPARITYDLWGAMTHAAGRTYMVDVFQDGVKIATERYQNVVVGNDLYKIKNGWHGPWEHYRLDVIEIDGEPVEVIRLVKDSSPENHGEINCHYEVVGMDTWPGGIWAKRWMYEGEVFIEPDVHNVTFYDSSNGHNYGDPRSGVNRNVCELISADARHNLKFGNPNGEIHHTSDGYGCTGWESSWKTARLSADDPGDYNNSPEMITLSDGSQFEPPTLP